MTMLKEMIYHGMDDRVSDSIKGMRPDNLPEYTSPPLNEVAIGVQFTPAPQYSQIHAGEVWNLFKNDFPKVVEQAPLLPSFETFGLPSPPTLQFGFGQAAVHNRYWFLSGNENELIQFQNDRLHHNWRNRGLEADSYPRFDNVLVRFSDELTSLEKLMSGYGSEKLVCNQAEVSYINHIPLREGANEISNWLRIDGAFASQSSDFNAGYRRVLLDSEKKPLARFTVEAASGYDPLGNSLLMLNFTVRGAPIGNDLQGTIIFLNNAREIIVNEFTAITTDSAHNFWKRTK
jgi:uncharacterized protein (TIGR04255 family)